MRSLYSPCQYYVLCSCLLLPKSGISRRHCCLGRWRSPDRHVVDPDRPRVALLLLPPSCQHLSGTCVSSLLSQPASPVVLRSSVGAILPCRCIPRGHHDHNTEPGKGRDSSVPLGKKEGSGSPQPHSQRLRKLFLPSQGEMERSPEPRTRPRDAQEFSSLYFRGNSHPD